MVHTILDLWSKRFLLDFDKHGVFCRGFAACRGSAAMT
jgi:hypothetical protein